MKPITCVIIPAHNEESAIAKVIAEIPGGLARDIIVVDNASSDRTADVARAAGVTVLHEPRRGYGAACATGISYVAGMNPPCDVIVFLDGDHSDYPAEMHALIKPIADNTADLVIGSRALGNREKGSMTIPQVFGNWLATTLLDLFFKTKFTDLGPFRAIRYSSLLSLNMEDRNYGWTVEMQIKAAKKGLRCVEVPVGYRKRIGVSKISGTIKGTAMAGYKILYTLFRYL